MHWSFGKYQFTDSQNLHNYHISLCTFPHQYYQKDFTYLDTLKFMVGVTSFPKTNSNWSYLNFYIKAQILSPGQILSIFFLHRLASFTFKNMSTKYPSLSCHGLSVILAIKNTAPWKRNRFSKDSLCTAPFTRRTLPLQRAAQGRALSFHGTEY